MMFLLKLNLKKSIHKEKFYNKKIKNFRIVNKNLKIYKIYQKKKMNIYKNKIN